MTEPTLNPYQPPRVDLPPATAGLPPAAKPVAALAKALLVALVLHGLGRAIVFWAMYGADGPRSQLSAGDVATAAEQVRLTRIVLICGVTGVVSFAISAVLWFVWLVRCNRNLRAFGFEHLQFSPAGAVLWWFVPLANLLRPFQVMRELWQGSRAAVDGRLSLFGRPMPAAIVLWWATLMIGFAIQYTTAWFVSGMEPRGAVSLLALGECFKLAALAGACWLVLEISRLQSQALSDRGEASASAPRPPWRTRLRRRGDPPVWLAVTAFERALLSALAVLALTRLLFLSTALLRLEIALKGPHPGAFARHASAEQFEQLLVPFAALALVLAFGLWLAWAFRCSRNLVALGYDELDFSPTATLTAWLVPVFNLIRPFRVVDELWRVSEAATRGDDELRDDPLLAQVKLWWLCVLASAVLAIFMPSGGPLATAVPLLAIVRELLILAAVGFGVALVREISRFQTQAGGGVHH